VNRMNLLDFKKWGFVALLLMLTVTLFVGCGATEETAVPEQEQTEETTVDTEKVEEVTEETAFPVTITDGAGQEVTIESEPQSIVSLIPSNTEIAFALGLGDKIVGVSDYCNYPAETADIEKVGAMQMDEEKILSLLPDLALLTPYQYSSATETIEKFKAAGINVIVVADATSFKDVYAAIGLIAEATGTQEKAEEIIAEMEQRLAEVTEKAQAITEKKTVWVEVSPGPEIYTTGKGTFMHEMLGAIQAINAAGEQEGWVMLTEEEIVQLNPDVIITTYGYYIENPSAGVLAREGWGEVPAIKNEQVFDVDNDTVTRPGPRLIDGVETLAKIIYPEIFNQ
jgi:iron complex transport system substrate-binding protein